MSADPPRRSWWSIRWRQFRHAPRPVVRAVGANLAVAIALGLVYLAYGTRDSRDVCWYPRSNKLFFRGLGVIARVERLDYWDGEE